MRSSTNPESKSESRNAIGWAKSIFQYTAVMFACVSPVFMGWVYYTFDDRYVKDEELVEFSQFIKKELDSNMRALKQASDKLDRNNDLAISNGMRMAERISSMESTVASHMMDSNLHMNFEQRQRDLVFRGQYDSDIKSLEKEIAANRRSFEDRSKSMELAIDRLHQVILRIDRKLD